MRVLYLLTDGFGGRGGVAQFSRDFLSAICAHGSVGEVVALPRSIVGDLRKLPEKLRYDSGGAGGKWRYFFRLRGWLVKRPGFDIIVCGHLNLIPLAVLAQWRSGAPLVLVLHGIEAWAPPKHRLRRYGAQRADWVVSVSEVTLRRFETWSQISPGRGVVLPCSVDLAWFSPGEADARVVEKYGLAGRVVILTLGRLAATEQYKGFDELLGVVSRLREAEPSVLCVIAGGGDDRARLEAKARDLGVEQWVRFTGYVPDEELPSLYRAARVFTLAGRGEGFGIVLLEAMACGIPVIASILDGSIEAVRQGELGSVVDPRDPDALTAGILQALRRPVGERPPGLEHFGYLAFEARSHEWLDRVRASSRRGFDATNGPIDAAARKDHPCGSRP